MSNVAKGVKVKKKRARLSFFNVMGELLLIAGLGILGFIVWQPWYSQTIVASQSESISHDLSQSWEQEPPNPNERVVTGDNSVSKGTAVTKARDIGDPYAVVYIPALGDDYSYPISNGTGRPVPLDDYRSGVGHYPTSNQFGEVGNTGIAAHRSGPLSPFRNIEYLRTGDKIYIESSLGWYTYTFRNSEVVTPSTVQVVYPFPYVSGVQATDSMLTLTSCYPKDGAAARIISYSTLDGFRSRADGPPAELAAVNKNVGKR